MENAELNKIPVRASQTASQLIEGEAIVLDIPGKVLRGLNPVASRIWQLIDGTRSLSEISATIAREFSAGSEEVARDVQGFLDELVDKQLITYSDRPLSPRDM
jgi:coenzyme PQQ biosynthesis protein PqqD